MVFELYQDHDQQWRWRLVRTGFGVIAVSGRGHPTRTDALSDVFFVKACANAPIRDGQPASKPEA
jgi:uncharacterized protein YegP (UPF0339 family)